MYPHHFPPLAQSLSTSPFSLSLNCPTCVFQIYSFLISSLQYTYALSCPSSSQLIKLAAFSALRPPLCAFRIGPLLASYTTRRGHYRLGNSTFILADILLSQITLTTLRHGLHSACSLFVTLQPLSILAYEWLQLFKPIHPHSLYSLQTHLPAVVAFIHAIRAALFLLTFVLFLSNAYLCLSLLIFVLTHCKVR